MTTIAFICDMTLKITSADADLTLKICTDFKAWGSFARGIPIGPSIAQIFRLAGRSVNRFPYSMQVDSAGYALITLQCLDLHFTL